jgi:hypothetical protein
MKIKKGGYRSTIESLAHVPSDSRSEYGANDAAPAAGGGSDEVSRGAAGLDFFLFFREVAPVMEVANAPGGNDAFSPAATTGAAAVPPDSAAVVPTFASAVAELL